MNYIGLTPFEHPWLTTKSHFCRFEMGRIRLEELHRQRYPTFRLGRSGQSIRDPFAPEHWDRGQQNGAGQQVCKKWRHLRTKRSCSQACKELVTNIFDQLKILVFSSSLQIFLNGIETSVWLTKTDYANYLRPTRKNRAYES